MGLMNIGPEAFDEAQEKLQKVLLERGYNNYTACALLLSLAGRILAHKDVDPSMKDEVVDRFLRSVGYTQG